MSCTLPEKIAKQMPRFSRLYEQVAYFEVMNPGSMASVRAEVETIKRKLLLFGINAENKKVWENWSVEVLRHIKAECRKRDLAKVHSLKKRRRLH